jgi:hypothetical protein
MGYLDGINRWRRSRAPKENRGRGFGWKSLRIRAHVSVCKYALLPTVGIWHFASESSHYKRNFNFEVKRTMQFCAHEWQCLKKG